VQHTIATHNKSLSEWFSLSVFCPLVRGTFSEFEIQVLNWLLKVLNTRSALGMRFVIRLNWVVTRSNQPRHTELRLQSKHSFDCQVYARGKSGHSWGRRLLICGISAAWCKKTAISTIFMDESSLAIEPGLLNFNLHCRKGRHGWPTKTWFWSQQRFRVQLRIKLPPKHMFGYWEGCELSEMSLKLEYVNGCGSQSFPPCVSEVCPISRLNVYIVATARSIHCVLYSANNKVAQMTGRMNHCAFMAN
jgi:hypothetical protein